MSMSFHDLSIDQAYLQIGAPVSQRMVGGSFRIAHLTSENGRTLNGKICRVLGFTPDPKKNPDMRLQCLVEGGSKKPMLIKGSNLVHLEASMMQSLMQASVPLSDENIARGLRQGLLQLQNDAIDRMDLKHRVRLYRKLLKKLERASKTSETLDAEDYCFPCGATYAQEGRDFDNSLDYTMSICRPACVGDNRADMRFMDLGLKVDGTAACSICTQVLENPNDESNSDEVLVTLPCVHMFHDSCLRDWLQSDLGRRNWNCPTCRRKVPHDLATYRVRYAEALKNRFQEFLLSGFCPKCILWIMEKDRNQIIKGVTNESGEDLTMGCVGKTESKIYARLPSS